MKTLLRILVLAVTVSMLFSTVSFAQYSDVKSTDSYSVAVDILSSLDILKGYEDGTFRPDRTITRAEFAAVICRTLGLGDSAAGLAGATVFSDVSSSHWASGYINFAFQRGIVVGLGDGTFAPDSPVTFAQAVKMIVAAMGYTPAAMSQGGYPTGYLAIAAQYGLTRGLTQSSDGPASRGTVATILYNALDVPLMEQTSFGTNTQYGQTNNMLLDNLDVSKVEAMVTKTRNFGGGRSFDSNEVELTINKEYRTPSNKRVFTAVDPYTLKAQDVTGKAQDYFENTCTVYIRGIDNSDPKVVAIVPKQNANNMLKLDIDQIDDSKLNEVSNGRLYYWLNRDKEKNDYVYIDSSSDLVYYLNFEKQSWQRMQNDNNTFLSDLQSQLENNSSYDITLIDNNGDDTYDVVLLNTYTDMVVDDVNSSNYKVQGKNGTFIYLDTSDKDYTIDFYMDGKPASFSDIRRGDVISYCGTKNDKYLENGRVYISNKSVSGTITELNDTDRMIYIDGEGYKYVKNSLGNMNVGDDGTFYINYAGKIVGNDYSTASTVNNFAFVTNIGITSGVESAVQGRFLKSNGDWVTYNFADRVNVNGGGNISSQLLISNWSDYIPSGKPESDSIIKVYSMVTYGLNSSNKINKINFDLSSQAVTRGYYAYKAFNDIYRESAGRIGSVYTAPNTIIFNVSAPDWYSATESDISVTSPRSLYDDMMYSGYAYVDLDSGDALAMVGQNLAGGIRYNTPFMVITNISYILDSSGDRSIKLTGYENGEVKYLTYLDSDISIKNPDGTNYGSSLKKGDVILYSLKTNNQAREISVLFSPSSQVLSSGAVTNTYDNITIYTAANDPDRDEFVYGLVRNKRTNSITLVRDDTVTSDTQDASSVGYFTIKNANIYIYDYTSSSSNKVRIADTGDIEYDRNSDSTPYSDEGDFIFARSQDGLLRDILIVKRAQDFKDTPAPTPSLSPATPSPTVNATPTPSPTPEATATPIPTETPSPAPTETPALTPAPTETPSAAPTEAPASTPAAVETSSPPATETPATTPSPAETSTPEPVAAPSPSPAETPAAEPTETPPPVITSTDVVYVNRAWNLLSSGTQVDTGDGVRLIGTNAFYSISEAISAVDPGGVIMVANGAYSGTLMISKPVTIKALGDMVDIKGAIFITSSDVSLLGLNIYYNGSEGNDYNGVTVLNDTSIDASTISVNNCKFFSANNNSKYYAIYNMASGTLDATGSQGIEGKCKGDISY